MILQGENIPEEILLQTAHIDEKVYPEAFSGRPKTILSWFHRNPDIYTVMVDRSTRQVVGYINAMPLEEDYMEEMAGGDLVDITMPLDAIRVFEFPDLYQIYFASIALDPVCRGPAAFKCLFDAYLEKLIQSSEKEVFVSEIIADVITESGQNVATYVGMEKLRASAHGSTIERISLLPPTFRVRTRRGQELFELYKTRHEEMKDYM